MWAQVPLQSTGTPTHLNAVSMDDFLVCFFLFISQITMGQTSQAVPCWEGSELCAMEMLQEVMSPMTVLYLSTLPSLLVTNENSYWDSKRAPLINTH